MAGHSKWANIKHRKAAQDVRRGRVFTKVIRELVVSAREGGGNVADNPRLRQAVEKALAANMKRDTIDKAIHRGIGSGEGENYKELIYEGYGLGGVAVLVKCLTDNVNRTASQVRSTFGKAGGNLGTPGSVAYLFEQKGQLVLEKDTDEDVLMEAALEMGAEDVVTQGDGSFIVLTLPSDFIRIKENLIELGFPCEGGVTMISTNLVKLDFGGALRVVHLIDALEDLDDVQSVYTNADIPEELVK